MPIIPTSTTTCHRIYTVTAELRIPRDIHGEVHVVLFNPERPRVEHHGKGATTGDAFQEACTLWRDFESEYDLAEADKVTQ